MCDFVIKTILLAIDLPTVDPSKASQDYVLKVEPMLRLKQLGTVSLHTSLIFLPR